MKKIKMHGNLLLATLALTPILDTGVAHAMLSVYAIRGDASSSIVYDPAKENALYGENLLVTGVTATDVQQNNGGTLAISGGILSFKTGVLTSHAGNVWNFAPGGTITLKGEIPSINVPSSTLLEGNLYSVSATEYPLGLYVLEIVSGTFTSTSHSGISQYFGAPGGLVSSDVLSLSFLSNTNISGGFSGNNLFNGIVVDSVTPTPVPAAFWLFGSGLAGLAGVAGKKRRA